jgi:hypothetical protein
MPKKSTISPSQIKTRSKNKNTHPGLPDRAPPRRTSVEVENERAEKSHAKAAQLEEKRRIIRRTAEFEHADMSREDTVDATPRPPFTPTPYPRRKNRKQASLAPVAESSDDSDSDASKFKELHSQESVSEGESATESDSQPRAKMSKAQTTGKAKVRRATPKKKRSNATLRAKQGPALNEAIVPSLDEEPPRKKKAKSKLRDEIEIETKKIQDDAISKNGGDSDMAKSMSSQDVGEERSATPLFETPSQAQAGRTWGRELKRRGAFADLTKNISDLSSANQPTKRVQPDDNNRIRQVILTFKPHVIHAQRSSTIPPAILIPTTRGSVAPVNGAWQSPRVGLPPVVEQLSLLPSVLDPPHPHL